MAGSGGARPGAGRKPKSDTFKLPIARAEKRIADHLPQLIDNMLHLANGGYDRVDEEWQPAGLVYIGSGEFARRAFPDLPDDEPVLVKRKRTIADCDRAANEYLINRILGRPTERQELTGKGGKPIEVSDARARLLGILTRRAADADESGDDGDPRGSG